jgi:large subunit ribosomal protein L22
MNVTEAQAVLSHLDKRAAEVVAKVVKSAATNAAHNHNLNTDDLFVSEIRVDEGVTLKRFRPRARGRAFPIRKRTSHIQVKLTTRGGEVVAEAEATKTEKPKKEEKKAAEPATKNVEKKSPAKKSAAKKADKNETKETKK